MSQTKFVKAKKPSKKMTIMPFINYLDGTNTVFLSKEYLDQMPLLRQSKNLKPVTCDLTTIESHMAQEAELLEQEGPDAELRDLAFVGRSNVGKSSLINTILGVQTTQTSKTPGKTKDLTFISLLKENCRLVDCPGYGYARASQIEKEKWRKFMQ